MNILYYYMDNPTPMCQWQHVHIIDELKHHNCFVSIFNPNRYENFDRANEELIIQIRKSPPDLFMTPHTSRELYVETIKEIKAVGIPTVLICFDNLVVPFIHLDVAPYYDLVWLTSKDTKHMFDKRGCNSVFLPYAANPYLKRGKEEESGIGFIGTPYGSRANTINALTKQGIQVFCHCKTDKKIDVNAATEKQTNILGLSKEFVKFPEGRKILTGAMLNKVKKSAELSLNDNLHMKNVVPPEELYLIYPRYSLALSSTTARNTGVLKNPLFIVNLRSFEIPMSGGIQFCRYSSEIASYFIDKEEIILYENENDMIEKAKYYLAERNQKNRQEIRRRARMKAEAEHTWWCRFVKVFECLNIKK